MRVAVAPKYSHKTMNKGTMAALLFMILRGEIKNQKKIMPQETEKH